MAALDLFYTFQFLKRLTTPFNKTDAFKEGLIDANGKLLKSPKSLKEKDAYTSFDRLTFNLKRLLGKLPGGKSTIASYAAALFLLKESEKHDIMKYTDGEMLNQLMEYIDIMKSEDNMINEEAPANAAGSGNVAGVGVGADGEPGVRRKRKKKIADPLLMIRRVVKKIHEERKKESAGLTIFDIDDTLIKTITNIGIKKKGKVVKTISNQEFNNYKLKGGESFDFSEFRDAKKFNKTSQPIKRMISKAKGILNSVKAKGGNSKVIMLTARADFDDKKLFLDTFRKFGLDIDNIYIERAGNLSGTPDVTKKVILKKYLNSGKYARIRMFDDSVRNINMFMGLKKEYPSVQFFGYLVGEGGRVKEIK
jgi:hypothetical protein